MRVCVGGRYTKTTDKAMAAYLLRLTENIRGSKVKISKSNIKEKQEEKMVLTKGVCKGPQESLLHPSFHMLCRDSTQTTVLLEVPVPIPTHSCFLGHPLLNKIYLFKHLILSGFNLWNKGVWAQVLKKSAVAVLKLVWIYSRGSQPL